MRQSPRRFVGLVAGIAARITPDTLRGYALAIALLLIAQPAAACRQALALGLDVSGSVDAEEYRQQLDGLALALLDRDVQAALLDMTGGPVRIAVFEWAGRGHRQLLHPWSEITTEGDIARLAARLRGHQRADADPATALGAAMDYGAELLSRQPGCLMRTLDISADGMSNSGPRPQDVAIARDITVNALVIGADDPAIGDNRAEDLAPLSAYFRAYVLRGTAPFVETARGYGDYATAMRRKLLRELQVIVIGRATP